MEDGPKAPPAGRLLCLLLRCICLLSLWLLLLLLLLLLGRGLLLRMRLLPVLRASRFEHTCMAAVVACWSILSESKWFPHASKHLPRGTRMFAPAPRVLRSPLFLSLPFYSVQAAHQLVNKRISEFQEGVARRAAAQALDPRCSANWLQLGVSCGLHAVACSGAGDCGAH